MVECVGSLDGMSQERDEAKVAIGGLSSLEC